MTDPSTRSLFAVTDVETTGLDPHAGDSLLEVAVLIVDAQTLEVLDETGFQSVVYYATNELALIQAHTGDYVLKMHGDNGLWTELEAGNSGLPLPELDAELNRYLRSFGLPSRSMPVMGNSPRLDLNFIDAFLPGVAAELSYRMVDVSTVAALSHAWHGTPWFPKASNHRAMDDVRACIEELRYYREASFK